MNHVREFTVCNPPLTDLRFYAPTDVNVTKFHYHMKRDVDGRITAIFETQEDGMYFGNILALGSADFMCRDRDSLDLYLGC